MTTHVSGEQVRRWIDDNAVREVTNHDDEETEFNYELRLSRLPIHVIKEETWGPLRVVGKTAFDTDRSRALLRDDQDRQVLLQRIGPMLAATPGFYTFLDEEGAACEFRNAEVIQTEYRIYPDEANQQALMDGLMGIASGMRYVRNTLAAMVPNPKPTGDETDDDGTAEAGPAADGTSDETDGATADDDTEAAEPSTDDGGTADEAGVDDAGTDAEGG
ncbi:hypothetical protein [Halorarum halophilum]|uniref:hypothetical protein n=1 Tax=Halorarum halophilum TaxID=2743090 RepID=UPI001C4EEBDB|nr:hypothetical protein [Halobaculum halophilum]